MQDQNKITSGITLPCHWDEGIIRQIVEQNSSENNIPVKEVYGVLAGGGPVGHGRIPGSVVSVDEKNALDYGKVLSSLGVDFVYLLNAPFEFTDESQRDELDRYLNWILGDLKPDALTITSHELMQYVRKRDPNIDIHISTIAGVKNADDLKKFLDVRPNRVVPHHDLGKHWGDLSQVIGVAKENGINVEMLSTESCLLGCPNRDAHYRNVGAKSPDSAFHTTCNAEKLMHPREFLLAGGIIRPEDVHLFEDLGAS
jgi:collagenase-like PrtC family protease